MLLRILNYTLHNYADCHIPVVISYTVTVYIFITWMKHNA